MGITVAKAIDYEAYDQRVKLASVLLIISERKEQKILNTTLFILVFQFSPVVLDLATAKAMDYEAALEDHLGASQSTPPGQALLFHNAGSLGNLKYLREMDDAAHLSAYFNLNIR